MGNLIWIAGLIVVITSVIGWAILFVKKKDLTRVLIPMWIGIVVMSIGNALM